MSAVLQDILAGLRGASALDQANLVLGVAGVVLMIRRSLWAFPVGLVAVSVQGVLFYRSRYYADATLQVVFFAVLAYGWWHWGRGRGAAPALPVTRLSHAARLGTAAAAVAATAAWGAWLRGHTDAVMPFRDAFIASFSVAGQVLQARKKLENWACWTIANVVAIASYWAGGLFYTAFLYAVYLGLGLAGWRAWASPRREGAA